MSPLLKIRRIKMENNIDKYKPIPLENGDLIAGFKDEVYCWYNGKELNIIEYPDLYKTLKEVCKEYFSKKEKK